MSYTYSVHSLELSPAKLRNTQQVKQRNLQLPSGGAEEATTPEKQARVGSRSIFSGTRLPKDLLPCETLNVELFIAPPTEINAYRDGSVPLSLDILFTVGSIFGISLPVCPGW